MATESNTEWKGYTLDEIRLERAKALIRRENERQRMLAYRDNVASTFSSPWAAVKGIASFMGIGAKKNDGNDKRSLPVRIAGSIIPAVVSNYSKLELAYLGVRLASMTFKMFKKLRRK